MSFEDYSSYKSSDIEWLEEMPGHWSAGTLRWLTKRFAGGTPDKTNLDYWAGGSIPWLNSGAVNQQLITEPSAYITQAAFDSSSARWIPAGALVMVLAGQGKTKGMVAQLAFETTCNQSMAAIVPSPEIVARYLYWWLTANYQNIRNMAGGDLRDGLNLELVGNIPCPIPSIGEQQAIATFLDRETTKIDTLVAEKHRLICLLSEKRQTVIAQAITKGLDPDVPMKDAGVDGLAKVPAHWEVAPLKRHWRVTDCKHLTAEFIDDGIPLASIREVQSKWVDLENAKQTTEHFYQLLIEGGRCPEPGDLIFSRNATVGEVAQVADTHPPFALGQDVVLLRKVDSEVCSDFLQNVLRSEVVVRQLNQLMIGSTFKRINVEEIRFLTIVFPPAREQREISAYLEATIAEFDHLLLAANEAVLLLLERRSALVSAAVTGKIDVRGKVAFEVL